MGWVVVLAWLMISMMIGFGIWVTMAALLVAIRVSARCDQEEEYNDALDDYRIHIYGWRPP